MTHEQAVATLATERYLLDEMSAADRQAFEEHFFTCDICAEDLRVAAAMVQGAKAGLAGKEAPRHVAPGVVTPSARTAWYRSAVLPWAAAAALAVVATYQYFWIAPSLPNDVATAVALAPVTLRPASRGAEPVVPLTSAAPVSLAVEINERADSGEVTYDLRAGDDGRRIASGRAAAPSPGTPLLLMISSSSLRGSARYVLSIHDAGPSHRALGEYRFAVSPR